jgi:maltose O-acetyltransferase
MLAKEIGNNSGIGINARIIGPVKIGNNVMMSPDIMIIANKHGYKNRKIPMINQGISEEKIEIGDDIWIGARSIILPGVKIASGCVIAAGSVVTKSFGPNLVIAGNPAKIIKKR